MASGPTALANLGPEAAGLASSILSRRLFHRALAFRARFHQSGVAFSNRTEEMDFLAAVWSPLSSDLSEFRNRVALEADIFNEVRTIAEALNEERALSLANSLQQWQIVVDLPENRIKPVSIYVAAEDRLDLPNLFFDPARWSQLQSREAYWVSVLPPAPYSSCCSSEQGDPLSQVGLYNFGEIEFSTKQSALCPPSGCRGYATADISLKTKQNSWRTKRSCRSF